MADFILKWHQHSILSFYLLFFGAYFVVNFSADCLALPLIDEWELKRDFLWLGRMMRAQTDAEGPNALPPDGFKYIALGDGDGDGSDDLSAPNAMDHVGDTGIVVDGRNASGFVQDASAGQFGGSLRPDDRLVTLNPNGTDNWWTLCQLPVFIVLFAVVGVLAVTFIVLLWLKSQMLENDKEKASIKGEAGQNILCPCPTHGNAPEDRWIFHTVINLKCGNEDKSIVPVQPQDAPDIVDGLVSTKGETSEALAAEIVETQTTVTPEKRPEAVRIKAKGLLERRGSNVSLTIDLPQANSDVPTHVITPTRECSAEEFLLSAGNTLNRSQLRGCLRDISLLHREFWDIPLNHPDEVQAVGCAGKNRYRSILPNERSRVLLEDTEDTYINANYMRGYDGEEKAYIATQGPLGNTVADLYHMMWTHRCPIIVMMTHLVEKTKPKCEPYFPLGLNESSKYGEFEVTVAELISRQGYVLRNLLVQYKGETRRIMHYWYDTWPDHKTPQNTHSILALAAEVEKVRTNLKNLKSPINNNDSAVQPAGPVVVHCSAGIGRSGCFIAISLAICQLLEENKVDLLGIVCQMRYDRGGMIQTAEQYEFVHKAVAMFEATLPDTSSNHD